MSRLESLYTPRLKLLPVTLAIVEAVMRDRRDEAERLVGARMPERWPNRELIERAFTASLDGIRADPEGRLWGDRVVVTGAAAGVAGADRVIGSVVFHGRPSADGVAEVAYGVEEGSRGQGFATEAVNACVAWALAQSEVRAVRATTFPWHIASRRVIEKVGMVHVDTREHEMLGELLVFERRRPDDEGVR